MLTRWYRTGVIYSADVGLFQDGNDDGIGDFQGMIGRLDYLARLGVSTIGLHSIHPSPRRDGGYDITDYYGVHLRFGSLGDFTTLLHEAGGARHPGHAGPGRQPHQRPASVVPGRALRSRLAVPGLV